MQNRHQTRLVAGVVLGVLAVGWSVTPVRGAVAGADALHSRVRTELAVFTDWLKVNGAEGYIGEVGWPAGADSANWNDLARAWYADAAAAGVWTTAWATGEWWGCGYKLSVYTWSTCQSMDGALSVARPQATVLEQQGDWALRGVNVAGGEFGTPGPLDSTSSFSNASPGTYDVGYHYDTQASFSYLASRGVTFVRIPLRWERIQRVLGGPLDPDELARLRAAIGRAGVAGLGVVVDVHNYGAYWLFDGVKGVRRPIGSAHVTIDHFAQLWSALSSALRSEGAVIGYGLMNEPAAMGSSGGYPAAKVWEQASRAAVTAIRANGDNRMILVPGYNWSGAQQWSTQHPAAWISDPAGNFRYEAHHYWDRDNSSAYVAGYSQEVADAEARGYRGTSTTSTTSTTVGGGGAEAPSTPAGLTLNSNRRWVGGHWSSSTGGQGDLRYEVYRSLSSSGPFTLLATVSTTRFDDYSVKRSRAYWYALVAVDQTGNRSAQSVSVRVVTR